MSIFDFVSSASKLASRASLIASRASSIAGQINRFAQPSALSLANRDVRNLPRLPTDIGSLPKFGDSLPASLTNPQAVSPNIPDFTNPELTNLVPITPQQLPDLNADGPDISTDLVPITPQNLPDLSSGDENTKSPTELKKQSDKRLRICALNNRENDVYGTDDKSDNILYPLRATGGLLFPYTPSVSFSQPVNYQSIELTHNNYDILAYSRTMSPTIGITGKFTVQNRAQGQYAAAVLHFLRSVSKTGFGTKDVNSDNGNIAGMPPPVLLLRGYGEYMFNDIRVVVRGHSWSFDENMDLIEVDVLNGNTMMLPPVFQIQIELGVVMAPKTARDEFSLADFQSGKLLLKGRGFI